MDESHFFLEDSLFNPWTYNILFETIPRFSHSIYIFISATIEESREILSAATPEDGVPPSIYAIKSLMENGGNHIWSYTNYYRASTYRPVPYTNNKDITYAIQESPKNEKWLIFVSSKKKGSELKKDIESSSNRSVSFFYSERKNTKEWIRIIKQERFNCDVLIVTKVLDNGVNIHDSSVKNIVMPFCERVDFLQMVGRRRTSENDENEPINIYVRVPTVQELNSQLNQIKKQDRIINAVIKASSKNDYFAMTEILQKLWMQKDSSINTLFYLDQSRTLVPNPLAFIKVEQRMGFLRSLMDTRDNPKILKAVRNFSKKTPHMHLYIEKVLAWLHPAETSNIRLASSSGYYSLEDLLKNTGPISKTMQEQFYQEIQKLVNIECGNRYETNPKLQSEMAAIRKGKPYRKAIINKELELLDIPLRIEKNKNTWVVKHIDYSQAP